MENKLKVLVELADIGDSNLEKATLSALLKRKIDTPVPRLIELLSHPCNKEQIDNIKNSFKEQYYSKDLESRPDLKDVLLESRSTNLAGILGTGKLSQDIYLDGKPDPRVACFKNLAGKFANESDPYKGSQQGLGRRRRKTKKHSKKSKKTLRRK